MYAKLYATTERVIYQGHHHFVTCDGVQHVAHVPCFKAFGVPAREVQCTCFCADPEYVALGFTEDIWQRYLCKQWVGRVR